MYPEYTFTDLDEEGGTPVSASQTPELRSDMDFVAPWDQQPGETDEQYGAFLTYRDMPSDRTFSAVAREIDRSVSTVGKWATNHSWRDRLWQWRLDEERKHREWVDAERKKAVKRQARTAQALNSKWLQRLQTIDPNTLSPTEMTKFAELALKMERSALMMDEKLQVEVTGSIQHVHALSPSDTERRIEALRRELEARAEELTSLPPNGYEDVVEEPEENADD